MSRNLIDSAYRSGELAEEFIILPFGKSWLHNKPIILDGKSKAFFEKSAKEYHHRMIDYNGESVFDDLTPASGWFHPVVKEGGLYASEVKWCSKMKELMDRYAKSYSSIYPITRLFHLSPVYLLDPYSVRVCNIKSMSLNVLSESLNRELFGEKFVKFFPSAEFHKPRPS